jgi:pterin-4a-carbinolamine dehydratase
LNTHPTVPSPAAPASTPPRPPSPPVDRLKAERVQLTVEPPPVSLKAERVQERLADMPGWKLLGARTLSRVREFPSASLAATYAGFLTRYAINAGHPVAIQLRGSRVQLTVRPRAGFGLTEETLSFAQALG